MNLNQCFYAVEVADTGSFSQAARNLYVSQPNLSHAVKQLEQTLGFPIFVRSPAGVTLTPEGSDIIERFRAVKKEYEQILAAYHTTERQYRLPLRVATLNSHRLVTAFSKMIEQYHSSPISFSFQNYAFLDDLLPLVETCQVDFAVIGTVSLYVKQVLRRLESHAIEYHPIADAPVCVAVGPKNPLYQRRDSVALEELYPFTVVQYGNAAAAPDHCLPHVTGLSQHVFGEVKVNQSALFYKAIENTNAVGLLIHTPEAFERLREWGSVRLLQVRDCDITGQYAWIKARRLPLSDIATQLLQQVKQVF